jgi:hypothetical protein
VLQQRRGIIFVFCVKDDKAPIDPQASAAFHQRLVDLPQGRCHRRGRPAGGMATARTNTETTGLVGVVVEIAVIDAATG